MSQIKRIYLSSYKYDVRYARACVASIRNWYPAIPITLIKDRSYGDYSTRAIERWWGCDVLDTKGRTFGWGFGKLEPLFNVTRERFLVLDADILFVGPLLQRLESYDEDFLVQDEPEPAPEFVKTNYYDRVELARLDSSFGFPGFTFNTGQWVGTGGLICREELAPWVDFGNPPKIRDPEVFKLGEQGLLNYLLTKGVTERRWTLARDRFMEVGTNEEVKDVLIEDLNANSPHRFLIHWCGCRNSNFPLMARGDLWEHFETLFYNKVRYGKVSKSVALLIEALEALARRLIRKLVPRKAPPAPRA